MTRAGIHADGLLKDEEIYNVFDTANNRPAAARGGGQDLGRGGDSVVDQFVLRSLARGAQVEKRSPEVMEYCEAG